MVRGTTPTHTFTLPASVPCETIDLLAISYAQRGEVVLEYSLDDVTIADNTISVTLSEADTLLFDASDNEVEIQLRAGIGTKRLASDIIKTTVKRILKDGEL